MAMVVAAEQSHAANEMGTVLAPAAAVPSGSGYLRHKNCLQEFTQKSGIQLPCYSTINEGSQHSPKFRGRVLVDGMQLTSPNTFSHKKDAEQDVAKLALQSLHVKFKNEGSHYVNKDTIFCKSILNEYGVKHKIDKPSYTTTQEQGLLPMFITTVTFDGKSYVGCAGKNKKEAEQNAACTIIDSILANSNTSSAMAQIIKSKGPLYAAVNKGLHTGHSTSKFLAENNGSNKVIETTEVMAVGTDGSWVPYPSSCIEIAPSNQVNSQINSSDLSMVAVTSYEGIPKKRKKRSKSKKKRKNDETKRARSDYCTVATST